MKSNDVGILLHDKVTRGITLTDAEGVQLEQWYAEQDQIESVQLTSTDLPRVTSLQEQVEHAMAQLRSVAEHIQDLTLQNNEIRQEIVTLQNQLAYNPTRRAA